MSDVYEKPKAYGYKPVTNRDFYKRLYHDMTRVEQGKLYGRHHIEIDGVSLTTLTTPGTHPKLSKCEYCGKWKGSRYGHPSEILGRYLPESPFTCKFLMVCEECLRELKARKL